MIKLADRRDIPEGEARVVHLPDGAEIALFHVNGQIYALDNACPHQGGPLGEGEIENGCVTCPWHGWQFDIATGSCLNMPGDDAKSLPLTIRGDEIYLML